MSRVASVSQRVENADRRTVLGVIAVELLLMWELKIIAFGMSLIDVALIYTAASFVGGLLCAN